jgi:transposase
MPGLTIRKDRTPAMLRKLAKGEEDARVARRLLAIASALEGMDRKAAAEAAGMDRQTLRDWVVRYNEHGIDGLLDRWSGGRPPRLEPDEVTELYAIVMKGPDPEIDGICAFTREDLVRICEQRFGKDHALRDDGSSAAKPFQKFTCSLADIDIAAQRIHRRGGDHGAQVEGAGSPGRWVARFQHRPRVLADEDGVQRDCPRSRRARHRLHRHEDELMGGRHERSRVARQAPDGGATCGLGGSSSRIFVASRTVS